MQDWYYSLDGKNKVGPVSKEELVDFINKGRLNSKTLVWQEGMSEWVHISTIDSLFPRDVPPPLPNKYSKKHLLKKLPNSNLLFLVVLIN